MQLNTIKNTNRGYFSVAFTLLYHCCFVVDYASLIDNKLRVSYRPLSDKVAKNFIVQSINFFQLLFRGCLKLKN